MQQDLAYRKRVGACFELWSARCPLCIGLREDDHQLYNCELPEAQILRAHYRDVAYDPKRGLSYRGKNKGCWRCGAPQAFCKVWKPHGRLGADYWEKSGESECTYRGVLPNILFAAAHGFHVKGIDIGARWRHRLAERSGKMAWEQQLAWLGAAAPHRHNELERYNTVDEFVWLSEQITTAAGVEI